MSKFQIHKKLFPIPAIFLVLLWGCALNQGLSSVPEVLTKVRPSVVQVLAPRIAYDNSSRPLPTVSMGSGVIIDPTGHVLTNHHIIGDAKEAQIFLSDGRKFSGKVMGTDPGSDLAVVMIPATNLPFLPLGDSSKLRMGETVIAVGNAMRLDSGPTAAVGVVSATNRSLEEPRKIGLSDLIQTDAAINAGNSGGPLVNLAGEVIGINITITPSTHGIGFAMASNRAKMIANELVASGRVIRPWLGIAPVTLGGVTAAVYDLGVEEGVLVTEVEKGSPGADAGLKPGDIIVASDGDKIRNFTELLSSLAKKTLGDTVNLEIRRSKKPSTVNLTLRGIPER